MSNKWLLDHWLDLFWQFNLDLSVILLTVLVVRFFIRKTTKSYNSYLLWLAIPLGFVVAKIIASIDFSSAGSGYLGQMVNSMVVKPVETLQSYWWLGLFWLVGSAIFLLRLGHQHRKLRQQLKLMSRPVAQLNHYRQLNCGDYPLVAIENDNMSPAVYGFLQPKIYFPIHVSRQLTARQMQLILDHEEQHIKQKHLWLNLLWDLLVCIGWFNPLIYIARKNFRHDQELFCDYLVLNNSDPASTKAYGHALLSTLSATHSVSLLCSWKVFNQLEERIMNITKPLTFTGKLALILGTSLVLGCSGIYAANKAVKEEKRIVIHDEESLDANGEKHIVVEYSEDGGVTYHRENDDFYIVENGNKRPMTEEERAAFEKKMEAVERELEASEEKLIIIEKEIEKKIEKKIEGAHQKIELHLEDIEKAHAKLEKMQAKGVLSEEEMLRVQEELRLAKEQIKVDREKIRQDLEKARQELERSRQQLKAPKQPPAPAAVEEAFIAQPPPAYPAAAFEKGVEGEVILTFDVDDAGRTQNIQVIQSSPQGVFDKEAIAAVKGWQLAQSQYNKKGIQYQLKFELAE